MYYERDKNGRVIWIEYNGNELRDRSKKVDHLFRKTIRELADTRVEICIKKLKGDQND
jgi:hypothetical protein